MITKKSTLTFRIELARMPETTPKPEMPNRGLGASKAGGEGRGLTARAQWAHGRRKEQRSDGRHVPITVLPQMQVGPPGWARPPVRKNECAY